MDIASLVEEDLPELARLYKQFWGEESSLDKMKEAFRRLSANPSYILLTAKLDGRMAGSVMGIVCEELYGNCVPFMVIEDFIVDEGCRRKGVGSALMKSIEERASKAGCAYIIFVTESKRKDAIAFYGAMGYEPESCRGFKKRLKQALENA